MAQRRGPDGTVRVAVSGAIKGEPWANVFWALLGGGSTATQASLDTWNANFGEAYYSNLAPLLDQTTTITLVQSTLFQPNETALHSSQVLTHQGAGTGGLVNNLSSCKVLSWQTSVYWRGGKPRTYVPGVNLNDTTDGKTLTSAAATGTQNAGQAFHTAINALSAPGITQTTHGFVSFMSGGVERVPSVFFPINACRAHHRIGTQRRRLGAWVP